MTTKHPKVQALYKSKKMTNIAYADWTINLQKWWCTKVSAGCKNCYMLAMAKTYPNNASSGPEWREKGVAEFNKMPPGAVVFLGDMYDVYHEQTPKEHICCTHELIASRPDVTVLVLTKRPHHPFPLWELHWPDNLWSGVTVEDNNAVERIQQLKSWQYPKHMWLSCEPLLEDISEKLSCTQLTGIEWVVCGAESGNRRRPFNKRWAENLRAVCERNGVPFFYKQSSGQYPGNDPYLEGELHYNFPDGIAPLKYRAPVEELPLPMQIDMFADMEGGE